MNTLPTADLEVRKAIPDDWTEVVKILRTSLNKVDDPHYEAFLEWKHRENSFGVSPAWVALHQGRVVGYRTMLRWRFRRDNGRTITAVRAVDTATDPAYQGRGIFRTLTLRAVAELTLAGDELVFNTPNDKSRPGYLKMGWTVVRQLPVAVLPAGPRAMVRMVTSRVPAQMWSEPTTVGWEADALADRSTADALLQHAPASRFRTDRNPAYLAWRTSFGPLHYRVLTASPNDPAEGAIVFRLRRRGDAVEAAVVEQLIPDARTGARLIARMLRATGADYAIGLRTGPSAGLVSLPRQGPLLTARPLAAGVPAARRWSLTLADVELF